MAPKKEAKTPEQERDEHVADLVHELRETVREALHEGVRADVLQGEVTAVLAGLQNERSAARDQDLDDPHPLLAS